MGGTKKLRHLGVLNDGGSLSATKSVGRPGAVKGLYIRCGTVGWETGGRHNKRLGRVRGQGELGPGGGCWASQDMGGTLSRLVSRDVEQ